MLEPDDDATSVRTITDADAKAIAQALLGEASRQVLLATGRGVWSTLKVTFFPLLIAFVVWWLANQGKPIVLPAGAAGIH